MSRQSCSESLMMSRCARSTSSAASSRSRRSGPAPLTLIRAASSLIRYENSPGPSATRVRGSGGQPQRRRLPGQGAVEHDLTVLVERRDLGLAQDLADRLLHAGLGQMAGLHAVPIGAHHRGLEARGERDLGDHHRQQRQHQHDRDQGEAALALHGAAARMGMTVSICGTPARRRG